MGDLTRTPLVRLMSVVISAILMTISPLGALSAAYATEPTEQLSEHTAADGIKSSSEESATVVREVPERRTENSKHFLMSDGTMRAEIYSAPVHYKDTSGTYVPLRTQLVLEDANGSHRTAAAGATAHFRGAGVPGRPVRLERDSLSIEVDMIGVSEKAHIAVGDTAYYLDVAESTSLTYESLADGLKQTLILQDASAPESFKFEVAVTGGELRQSEGGGWAVFTEEQDLPVFDLGEIVVWDSSAERSYCESATLEIEPRAGGAVLTYRVPRGWLDDPARVWPVFVDPTFNQTAAQDTYIHNKNNTTAHGGEAYLYSGMNTTTGSNHALLRFDLGSVEGARINSATFSVYCNSLTANTYVYLRRNTTYWSESWKYPDGLPASDYLVHQKVAAAGWVNWNVLSTVQQWAAGVGSPWWYGFQMMNPATDGTAHYKRYYSSEYATVSLRPKLVIDYTLVPDPVAASGTFATSSEWFREVDRNGDGISDTPNDQPGRGRGVVDLTWPQAARADGYDIYAYDGDSYEKVGTVFGKATTSWSSEGSGMFPTDSEINGWSVASRNALTRAASPRAMSKETQVTVPDEAGAGVVVTDGTYLYVRAWNSLGYEGPTAWKKVGTGLQGTQSGADYGTVGPDFAEKPIISGFYLDGVLYNGYLETASTISGVPTTALPDEDRTVGLSFHDESGAAVPILNRVNGLPAAPGDINVMLASDGERIYNVCYGTAGTMYAGYTIRVFDRTGLWLGDHTIPGVSQYTNGVLVDGSALYLMRWVPSDTATVTKVRLSDWKIANQWPINQATTRVINGCYDKTNNHFWLGSLDDGTVYRYLGSGLDLRDSPNALYRKSTTQAYLTAQNYWFRVVPFNSYGQADLALCGAYMPTLDNRTVRVNDEDRDTTHALGEFAGHDMTAVLDEAALDIGVTDLTIASWGPEAAVSRHYTSDRTAAGLLAGAPGWRFDFERTITAITGGALLTDERGEQQKFVFHQLTGTYHSPNGRYDRLTTDASGDWVLVAKDRSREVYDGTTGKLTALYDKNGKENPENPVTYAWGASSLVITAANGQSIDVAFGGTGAIASATYETDDGTRQVTYATSGTPTVTYFDGDATCEYAVTYGYTDGLMTALSVPDYPKDGQTATRGFVYSSGALSEVRAPEYASDPNARSVIAYTGGAAATVTSYGDVGTATSTDVTHDAAIDTHYTWNPTGTLASMVDAHVATSADPAPWTYTYSQGNDATSEKSPTGKLICRSFDTRGNVLATTDEDGNRTTYEYDARDQVVKMIDERLCTTTYSYSTTGYEDTGNLLLEQKQLTPTERSKTEYGYDAKGRTTSQREYITPTESSSTTFGPAFSDSGEPLTTIRAGVVLASGTPAVTLTESAEYDDFGNLLSSTDASGVLTNVSGYDIAGRVKEATDAAGIVTFTRYDRLGNETVSWREAAGQIADEVRKTYDASGRTICETYLLGDTQDRSVTHDFDASGRETASNDSRVSGEAKTVYDARSNAVLRWSEGTDTGTLGAATRSTFDAYGQLEREIASGETSATTHEYYANGLTKKTTNPDCSYTRYLYDAGGLVIAEYTPDSDDPAKSNIYDIGGRLVSSTSADGATTTYGYDLLSRQVSAGAEGQAASTTVHNTLGWVLSETDSDGVQKTKRYDVCGRVVAETEAGKASETAYDEFGRSRERTDADGTRTEYTYDPFSRIECESQEASGGAAIKTTTTAYDALSRATTTTVEDHRSGTTRVTTVAYPVGSQAQTTVAFSQPGATTTITLDAKNLETSRSSETSAGTLVREATDFDASNRETDWTFRGVTSSRRFDAAGRLWKQSGEGFDGEVEYTFDPATGRKSREVVDLAYSGAGPVTTTYTYTDTGRLASAGIGGALTTYAYETGSGNIQGIKRGSEPTSTLSYDSGNRVTTMTVDGVPTTTYTWDTARGWRTAEGPAGGASTRTFTYTDAGRLATFTDAATGTSATYAYDAAGQRTSSVVTHGSTTTTTTFTYEGLTLLALEAAASDGTTSSVTYLSDASGRPYGGVYAASESSPVAFGIVTTDRGDVVELTDSQGEPFAFYAYDACGTPTASESRATGALDAQAVSAIAGASVLRYASYCYDEHSGLYYLSQRYYDPATASFITKDPAKADGEESAYQYCGGDPVGKVDPSGEVSLKTLKRYYSEVLNADERKVANRYWYQLASYYTAYKEAIQIKGEDNKGDALRHAYWNALLTRMLGSTSAKRWTDAHETGDRRNKFNQRAMRMDLHNNKVGRDIAKKYPYGTKKDVKNWIQQSGRLVWFGHGV